MPPSEVADVHPDCRPLPIQIVALQPMTTAVAAATYSYAQYTTEKRDDGDSHQDRVFRCRFAHLPRGPGAGIVGSGGCCSYLLCCRPNSFLGGTINALCSRRPTSYRSSVCLRMGKPPVMWLPKTQKGRAKFLLRRAKGLNTYEGERLRRHIARELRWRFARRLRRSPVEPSLPLRVESLGHLQMLL